MLFLDRFLEHLKQRSDCDFVDRVNYYYTPLLLAFFALTLSAKQYAGQPIQCWMPAQFTGAWEQYSEYYCFVKNTYFVPFHEDLPASETERSEREIGYYQWVPFILALQALLFFIPIMIWRLFNWQSGIWVKGIVNAAIEINNVDDEKRNKQAKIVAMHIEHSVKVQNDLEPGLLRRYISPSGKHLASYVTSLYLFIKCLNIINVIGQLFLLNRFLGPNYTLWGMGILKDVLNGRQWEETGHFPRVTMCDFKVRVLGNLHNWSVQCVLMINMFNEKIYLFLWWWFLVVAILTIINFVYWSAVCLKQKLRRQFVDRYLHLCEKIEATKVQMAREFLDNSQRPDVALLLRLISTNCGDVAAKDIVKQLWKNFKDSFEKQEVKIEKEKPPPPPLAPSAPNDTPDTELLEDF